MKPLILGLLSFLSSISFAITPEDVKKSVVEFFPQIIQEKLNIDSAKGDLRSKGGAFDSTIEYKNDSRIDGYYDGKGQSVKVLKPFRFLNSKIYGGYKTSRGDFPEYDEKMETLDSGEVSAGLKLSVLRDRMINDKLFKEKIAKLKLSQAENKLKIKANQVIEKSLLVYWKWVVKGEAYKIYSNLLQVSLNRGAALEKRFKRGDVAKIKIIENQQYINERKTQKIKAYQDFINTAIELSLYYRDTDGNPSQPTEEDLPKLDLKTPDYLLNFSQISNENKLTQNEAFQNIDLELEKIEKRLLLASNSLAPRLDVGFETSRDNGNGPKRLFQTQNRAMVTLEIPLERNLGKGAVARETALKKRMMSIREFTKQQLLNLSDRLKMKKNASQDVYKNSSQEVIFASKLLAAEETIFNRGGSDFFVLNAREQKLASARIKRLKALMSFKEAVIKLKALYWEL